MLAKKQLRTEMKTKLEEMDSAVYAVQCGLIHSHTAASPSWERAETIAFTISRGKEVDTFSMIEQAWKEGKTVAVPKCEPKTKEMIFRALTSFDELETVYFGLQEPIPARTALLSKEELDLIFVPGICFDHKGFRIGYGGGYYDRYLKGYKGETAAMAFSMQLLPEVPFEKHDIPVQYIFSEDGVITCRC
ncbi:5-formyltetrahydrofolate cyclo-ligase [Bacillus lacus]|uniref:5-formyltetrahydrofolate cyclo-ligase n=2 Tax=Metabacillus lacus TaxID=1983721 RepID=A0A7X2IZG3_9BACI|nr:5-formyltetrahydrofolate cyclo-ligase [Metabacillus lacus]